VLLTALGHILISFAVVSVVSSKYNAKFNTGQQTGILIVLCFMGNLSEIPESEVRDLNDPSTIQQTVGTLQTTVKLQRTFVNIFHSLSNSHTDRKQNGKPEIHCTSQRFERNAANIICQR